MANRKLSVGEAIFWLIMSLYVLSIFGCAAQTPREDSNNYRAQAQQGYPCPRCDYPVENISTDIGVENKCSNCGKLFFYTPQTEPRQSQDQDRPYQGPQVFGRGYYSNIKYDNKVSHSVKNNWKVSDDGNSGSMSQTSVRSYEHTTDGEHGTLVGPGANYGYGGY